MTRTLFNTDVFADPAWWHWALTIPLLAAHLLGVPWAIEGAIILCATMTGYYFVRLRRLRPYPVQLRIAYIGWLLIGLLPAMHWMLHVTLVGLVARVLFGYCLLARLLSLAWFNREEPLTFSTIRRIFVSRPVGGLLFDRSDSESAPQIGSCSLAQGGGGIRSRVGASSLPSMMDRRAVGESTR